LNSAFAIYLGWLLGDERLEQPYIGTQFYKPGKELAESVWHTEDRGHLGDMEVVQVWAERFGIRDWFQWTHFLQMDEQELRG
jgi:hypothetical protein